MNVQIVDNVRDCAAAVSELMRVTEVAVDIEGIDHGRDGTICLIQASSSACHTVIFDISTMGAAAFSHGRLAVLLEDRKVTKVVFDGRTDNDALFHQYGYIMKNVYDIQVLQILKFAYRGGQGLADPAHLKGLEKCLELSRVLSPADMRNLQSIRARGKQLYLPENGGRFERWLERPLRPELIEYAAADVPLLLAMKQAWADEELDVDVVEISESRIHDRVDEVHPQDSSQMKKRDFCLPPVCTRKRAMMSSEAARARSRSPRVCAMLMQSRAMARPVMTFPSAGHLSSGLLNAGPPKAKPLGAGFFNAGPLSAESRLVRPSPAEPGGSNMFAGDDDYYVGEFDQDLESSFLG